MSTKLRRFRFGLRTLLLWLFVAACAFGWFGWELEQARQQRDAVTSLIEISKSVDAYDRNILISSAGEFPNTTTTSEPHVTDAVYNALGRRPPLDVQRLCLQGTTASAAGYVKTFAHLEQLNIRDSRLSTGWFEIIATLPRLRVLEITDSPVEDDWVSVLKSAPQLEHVSFDGCNTGDEALQHLSQLATLKWLSISSRSVTDRGVEYLTSQPTLQTLWLKDVAITDVGMAHISHIRSLRNFKLHLVRSLGEPERRPDVFGISDDGARHLASCDKLETLTLIGTPIGDVGIAHLAKLPSLSQIELVYNNVTDVGLDALRDARHLTLLSIPLEYGITDEGVAEFRKARPDCKVER